MSGNRLALNSPLAFLQSLHLASTTNSGGGSSTRYTMTGFPAGARILQIASMGTGTSGNVYNGVAYDSRNVTENVPITMTSITSTMIAFGTFPWYQQVAIYPITLNEATTGTQEAIAGSENGTGNFMTHASGYMIHKPNTLSALNYYIRSTTQGYHVAPANGMTGRIIVWEIGTL